MTTIEATALINHVKSHLYSRSNFCTTAGDKVDRLHVCDRSERHDNLSLVIECDNCDFKNFCSNAVRTNLILEFVN